MSKPITKLSKKKRVCVGKRERNAPCTFDDAKVAICLSAIFLVCKITHYQVEVFICLSLYLCLCLCVCRIFNLSSHC